MAILMIEGFDLYTGVADANLSVRSKWTFDASYGDPSIIAGRFGGQALQFPAQAVSSGGNYISRLFTAAAAVAVGAAIRFATMPTSATGAGTHIGLFSDAVAMVGFRVNPDGSISALRMTNVNTVAAVLGSSVAGVILAATWHYVEFISTISDTVGTVDIVVDGVTVLTLAAQDTRNGAPTTVNKIYLGPTADASTVGNILIDDLYITDGVSLGQRRIDVLRPTVETVSIAFVPSTGTDNAAMVNDITADSTDYVESAVLNDLDLYEFGNLASIPSAVDAVQLVTWAIKTDAGSRNLALVADIAGVQTISTDLVLGGNFSKQEVIMATKPGGGAWAGADVNAARFGQKVTL